jgi:hypothetical protein
LDQNCRWRSSKHQSCGCTARQKPLDLAASPIEASHKSRSLDLHLHCRTGNVRLVVYASQ